MSLYNLIDEYILVPIADVIYGSHIFRELRNSRRYDKMTAGQIREVQDQKLQKLVKHCYETVPYYTKLFDSLGLTPEDIRSADDLAKLPVLTKQTIRDNYDDLYSTAISPKRRKPSTTGGSTGTPLKYCIDKDEWSVWKASTIRSWEWVGVRLGDKIFSIGGNSINQKKGVMSYKGMYDRLITRNFKFSSADVSDECMQRHYESFMKLKPKMVRGYGSSIYIFACYIEKNHLPVCKIKAIQTTGEVLMPEYRRKMEQVFGCRVYDNYGAGDSGILSYECLEQNGFHIAEEHSLIEITDKNGHPLPDGQTGYVCSTDLENYVFPFLRYFVGDMAYIKTEKCRCGRQTRMVGEVMGRAGKLMYNKQGVPLSPTMLSIMLRPDLDCHSEEKQVQYNKIDRFQIRQDADCNIRVLLKLKDPDEDKSQFDYVIDNFQNHFVGSTVSVEFVDEIPTLPSGKEDYCVSEYEYQA